jgi:hypothetical protein
MARRDRLGLILPGNRLGVLVTLPLVFPPAAEHRETDDDRAGQRCCASCPRRAS